MGRGKSLLDEIQKDALDSSASVADALRKCIALGGEAESAELRDWAARELEGYGPEDDLPDYRVVPAPICIDGMSGPRQYKGHQISPAELPAIVQTGDHPLDELLHLRHSIGELEELARSAKAKDEAVRFLLPGAAAIARLITHEKGGGYQAVTSVYWSSAPSTIFSVVDAVRNKLVKFVAEVRAGADDATAPTPEEVSQAVNVAVHGGKRTRVTVTTAQSGSGSSGSASPDQATPRPWWRSIWGFAVGAATIAAAVITWLMWRSE